jgi:hypothetical protein
MQVLLASWIKIPGQLWPGWLCHCADIFCMLSLAGGLLGGVSIAVGAP